MTVDRFVATAVLAASAVLYWLAYSAGQPEAYLFPRMISIGMGAIAAAMLVSTFVRPSDATEPAAAPIPWRSIVPALALFAAYRWALESLGFYAATFLVFALIVSVYAPRRGSVRQVLTHIAVAAVFTALIYGLFAVVLRVQTPHGLLI